MASQIFNIELEVNQVNMYKAVPHSEVMKIRGFVSFLASFYLYLTTERKMFGEWKLPGWTGSQPWLVVMNEYLKMVGFPEKVADDLKVAYSNEDVRLLEFCIEQGAIHLQEIARSKELKEVKHD